MTPFWRLVWERSKILLGVDEPEGQDIAQLTGQSPSAVSLWRKGQTPNPRFETMVEIAHGLALDPDEVWQAVKESSEIEELPKGQPVTLTRTTGRMGKLSSLPVRKDRPSL